MAKVMGLRALRAGVRDVDELWPSEVFIPSHVMSLASTFMTMRRQGALNGKSSGETEAAILERVVGRAHWPNQLAVGFAAWRSGKTIYRFDSSLAWALGKTPMNNEIPVEVLKRLPQYGTYVEVKFKHSDEVKKVIPEVFGMLAFYDMVDQPVSLDDKTQLVLSLVMVPIIDGRGQSEHVQTFGEMMLTKPPLAIPLLKGRTVEDCLKIDQFRRGAELSKLTNDSLTMWNMLLNMVLYVCSEEPDKEGVRPGQTDATRRDLGASGGDVEAWNVGTRLGAVLRKVDGEEKFFDESIESSGEPTGVRMRPHIRTGHWHGYWFGPRNADARGYRMKWVAPTLVNADSHEDIVSTVRRVQG